MKMNNFGISLIYGHPLAPTAGKIVAEVLEEMADLGGGTVSGPVVSLGIPAASMILKVG